MKNLINKFSLAALFFASVILVTSCNKDEDTQPENPTEDQKSIAQIASDNESFSILTEALVKADLVNTLEGEGPFTVFAPTNEAFNMLFGQLGINGIEDLSADELKPILLYHVIGASAKSSSLITGYLKTLNTSTPDNLGTNLFVEVGANVMLNGTAKVNTADIEANNGIIHVIDKVLLPPTVVDIAIANPNFSILVEAVVKAGLVDALSAEGPFTVFAPTNEAFQMLFNQLGVNGIADISAEDLIPILLYHVVSGNIISTEVESGMVPTLNQSADLKLEVSEMGVLINENSKVIAVDVQGTNGVIHAIDKVLLP
jgi:transforming growth factor-beta-induced protein